MTASEEQALPVPLLDGLGAMAARGWSGHLRVMSEDDQVGVVVMREGRVAWAVCKYQREDLGTFLLRLGKVTAEQLKEVRERYEALGKTRKLAALLEEAGLTDRSTLRRSLQLHIRRALTCMLSLPSRIVSSADAELTVDEDMTFFLDELLPGLDDDQDPALLPPQTDHLPGRGPLSINAGLLKDLAGLPGYRGALVATTDGRIYAGHGLDEQELPLDMLVGVPSTWLRSSAECARSLRLGGVRSTVLECDDGVLLARWIVPDEEIFLSVFFEEGARIGVAKHRIAAAATKIEEFIASTLTQDRVSG